ncbi:hypothetical protein NC652_031104 [Populus alba x Populus x berolinensis]|nr:hypothetical protein NC652_031104 [Populus alba x Populus x berolinensis]
MALHCYIFSFNKFQWKRRNIIISPLLSRRRRQPPSLPMTSASRSSIQVLRCFVNLIRTHPLGMLTLTPMCSSSSIIPGRAKFVNDNLTVSSFICVIIGKKVAQLPLVEDKLNQSTHGTG